MLYYVVSTNDCFISISMRNRLRSATRYKIKLQKQQKHSVNQQGHIMVEAEDNIQDFAAAQS